MKFCGRPSLNGVHLCLFFSLLSLGGAVPGYSQQNPPAQPPKPQQQNPFETVPDTAPSAEPPQQPAFEEPKPAEEAKPAAPGQVEDVIEAIEFRGARLVPQDTLRALIFSKPGDKLDEETLRRDFTALWNTGRFDDISLEKEPGKTGWIIRFRVTERRRIRSIKYEGMKSVTVSEILDRFKERRVGLSVEQQYDPGRIQRAAVVLKEYLAERGRQFATVVPEIRQIPPSSLEVNFKVTEGPKVKVGDIDIEGNTVFNDRAVVRSMRALRPYGIPHSILFENVFAKAFDSTKFEIDTELIRQNYMDHGYFLAKVDNYSYTNRDVGGGKFRVPLFYMNRPGKRADLKIDIEEGRQYHLNKVNFVGVKLFRAPEALMRPIFGMGEGDVFSTEKLRKGIEEMRKLYGNYGYIDFVPVPDFYPIPDTDKIDVTFNVDEGKQFFVRRIDFVGNTTTRDKVIRREILLDEGQVYDTHLWDLSILRLNQLGYFEALKEDEAADIKRDTRTNTVDITLRVKERGKNSIQLNGGVSGIAGSFIGFGYSTNNFLGLGETLSFDAQLGDRIRNVTLGFTEPYLFDRPISAGFTVYTTRFNYDQGREVSLLTGRNLIPLYDQLGTDNLLNYVSNGHGFTTFVSMPTRKLGGLFARVGLTYSYGTQNITTLSTASSQYFNYINFQGLEGQNQLTGIRTSALIPSYSYNSVDHPITPTRGKSLYITTQFAGIGGNVRMIEPTVDFKWFFSGLKRGHVIGMHGLARYVSGFGGRVAPPYDRFFMGGENDIRGFNVWGISPVAYVPSSATVPLVNSDGSARLQKVLVDGVVQKVPVTQNVPVYQLIFPGGDTQLVGNFEYRIPIAGPVVLAAFFDAGINKITRPNQLLINSGRLAELNGQFPQASFSAQAVVAQGTQKMRSSTGLELQVMMPVLNAPFRFYWAYNPQILRQYLVPPIVVDRSYFPNNASFIQSIALYGQAYPFFEDRKTFRFTLSRTF